MGLVDSSKNQPTLIGTIGRAASIWLTCLFGFYLFLPTILGTVSYSTNPYSISIYYLFWLTLALYSFWPLYRGWSAFAGDKYGYGLLGFGSLAVILYLTYIFPQFEPIHWSKFWPQPSEILYATPAYFLPKSLDILLQQLLLAAIVLSFDEHGFKFKTIRLWCMGLFGLSHILLIFGDNSWSYIITFTFFALGASYLFPYLLLRVKNGLLYSYFLHWTFYAVIIVLLRTLLG